jgi:hypothetical protein
MKKLGAKVRADNAFSRETVSEGAAVYSATAAEKIEVTKRWASAKRRIKDIVRLDGFLPIDLVFARPTDADDELAGSAVAFHALVRSCAPLTVPVGLQDVDNPFHEGWVKFCRWALSEELFPELWLEHDSCFVRTTLRLRVRPFPVSP